MTEPGAASIYTDEPTNTGGEAVRDDPSTAFYLQGLQRKRERYAPGRRVLVQLPDDIRTPGVITHYWAASGGMVNVALDRGDSRLITVSRVALDVETGEQP